MTPSDKIVKQIQLLPLHKKTTLVKIIMDMIEKEHAESQQDTLKDLQAASISSTEFWDNAIDDEVWNED